MVWTPPAWREILDSPLPEQRVGGRVILRSLTLLANRQVRAIYGIEDIDPALDPFILAINHNTMRESLLVSTVVILNRGGRLVHFLSDWNYRLVPGLGALLRRVGTIPVGVKPAKPPILNRLKPLFVGKVPGWERARIHLRAGRSVGIFPEATVNRDPRRGEFPIHLKEASLQMH
jgi:1-acyl-sn-glycerol-3-phosphate acyltransferase